MDFDATMGVAASVYFTNGECLYPNIDSVNASWPHFWPAIQTTSSLAPGATQTMTWSNVATMTAGRTYWVWCSGMVYGPWTAR